MLVDKETGSLVEPGLFANPFQLKTGIAPEPDKQRLAAMGRGKRSNLTLMEAASAALTVSFTALFSF